ncbi:MAG: hypothetical protein K2R98_02660 [Gemmataceae bacterium]|nr:hypothetical protein [Gemmataceae bacterium]
MPEYLLTAVFRDARVPYLTCGTLREARLVGQMLTYRDLVGAALQRGMAPPLKEHFCCFVAVQLRDGCPVRNLPVPSDSLEDWELTHPQ